MSSQRHWKLAQVRSESQDYVLDGQQLTATVVEAEDMGAGNDANVVPLATSWLLIGVLLAVTVGVLITLWRRRAHKQAAV